MTNDMEQKMINYLQHKLTKFQEMLEKKGDYYRESEIARAMDEMLACKEMVECLIQKPVNLQKNGKVTVGF